MNNIILGDETWRCPSGLPYTETVRTHNGHCYQFVDKEKYWTSARDYCWKVRIVTVVVVAGRTGWIGHSLFDRHDIKKGMRILYSGVSW